MQGCFDDLDEYQIEGFTTELKNSLMIPLYTSLKGIIKKLKQTEVDRVFEELEVVKAAFKESIVR